jgi:hypothetical protein
MDGTLVENGRGEGYTSRNIVKDLLKDLEGHGHIATIDNYFASVP